MAGLSLGSFTWYRGGARIEGNFLIAPVGPPEPYHPAEHTPRLLDSIQRVRDESTALAFAEEWGDLGLRDDVLINDIWDHGEMAAITFAELLGIPNEVARFTLEEKLFRHPCPPRYLPGDPLEDVLTFAAWVRGVARLRSLLALFEGSDPDEQAGRYETREWLTSEDGSELWRAAVDAYHSWNHPVVQRAAQAYGGLCREHFTVKGVLEIEREKFSDSMNRAIWIGIRSEPPGSGEPVIHFDGLFRFIQFSLLANGGTPEPRRCADPKCGAVFFPTRKGQRYCPPPPGARRSRCENRHGVERRRRGR